MASGRGKDVMGYGIREEFNYVYSMDIDDVNFRIKVGSLEGKRPEPNHKSLIEDPFLRYSGLFMNGSPQNGHLRSDLMIVCEVTSNGKHICPTRETSYKSFSNRWSWNEWIKLGIKISDLPRDTILSFTIYDTYGPDKCLPVGSTSISVFSRYGSMRKGFYDLRIKPGVGSDPTGVTTCGKSYQTDRVTTLNKMKKKYEKGQIQKIEWLDKLTFPEMERIREKDKKDSTDMFLSIEFPKLQTHDGNDYVVVYFEREADESCQMSFGSSENDLMVIPDPEMSLLNLIEDKHHTISRSGRSGLSDRDLKPNPVTRDLLSQIVHYPSTKIMSSEEQDLVWKFRFYLINQKKALAKFLKCINWSSENEVQQAIGLLYKWSPMDIEDALELLSPNFKHASVRRYAVSRLQKAPDDDLLLYLLQLVQALKYEDFDEIKSGLSELNTRRESITHTTLTSGPFTEVTIATTPAGITKDKRAESFHSVSSNIQIETDAVSVDIMEDCDLATFLINRSVQNETLANYFYWYLMVECEEHKISPAEAMSPTGIGSKSDGSSSLINNNRVSEMYLNVVKRFSQKLLKGKKEQKQRRSFLSRQQIFVEELVKLLKKVQAEKADRIQKEEYLQMLLLTSSETSSVSHSSSSGSSSSSLSFNFMSFDPLPLPVDPDIRIKGVMPSKASVFKSALMPAKLTFLTTEDKEYVTIVKIGDDLRQDQLILQTITLIDKLLRRENLDLKLTPYRVLATSSKHGFVQYIESLSVAEVLKLHNDKIQNYFRSCSPNDKAPYGISHDLMDTYVRSCAGYCIITYLLGVGDRHLDNLLLTKSGHLFHIDFGYILGRDPKPFPPPMKLSREMVEAMGGVNSEHYQQFRKFCYTAFLHLRRHANLILNLFTLMVDATIPDIALEPDKTVKKVQDKFRLDLSDEEAVHYIQQLIEVSATAVMASVMEQVHKFAQYWRK